MSNKTSNLNKGFDEMKSHLIEQYGEDDGIKLYLQFLKDTARGVAYTADNNPIAEYERLNK